MSLDLAFVLIFPAVLAAGALLGGLIAAGQALTRWRRHRNRL